MEEEWLLGEEAIRGPPSLGLLVAVEPVDALSRRLSVAVLPRCRAYEALQ